MKPIIFWGASGHSKVLRECVKDEYNLIAIFDNNKNVKSPFIDVPIYYGKDKFKKWINIQLINNQTINYLVTIGENEKRDRIELQRFLELYITPIIAKHKTSFISNDVEIGLGTQILANSSICIDVKIGEGCIINTGAIVDHDCIIGNGVHICPGAHIAGYVEIENYATIYTGAIIFPRIKIGEGAVVGAGAVVRKNVEPYTTVVGNPAKIINHIISKKI